MAKKKLTPSETAAPPSEPPPAAEHAAPEPPAPKKSRGRKAETAPTGNAPEPAMSVDALAGPAEPEGAEPPMDESSAIRTFEALVFATNEPDRKSVV